MSLFVKQITIIFNYFTSLVILPVSCVTLKVITIIVVHLRL